MIKLILIEDNLAYSKALEIYLSKIPDIDLIYKTNHLDNLKDMVLLQPQVIIMDIDLGRHSGIEGVRNFKKLLPETGILMLTVFEDEEKIFQSIKAGALGYLLKKDSPEKIVEAIRSIAKGESVMNGQIARKILDYFSKPSMRTMDVEQYNLTKREKEILSLLMDGLSYKQIATQCFISMDTLYTHIRRVYNKLDVHSRSEIAARFR
jgi:DNA-binding NarL/FixJ family response regulator